MQPNLEEYKALNVIFVFNSEDMIDLLGKRPFVGKADDMDKWLDQNRGSERSAPPPLEEAARGPPEPAPAPVTASKSVQDYKW